jgi:hypothetical protein
MILPSSEDCSIVASSFVRCVARSIAMTDYSFEAILIRPEGVGTWTYLNIPTEVSATFGSMGQMKVKGTINGYGIKSTALPHGDGTHYLVIGKGIRDQIHAAQGEKVQVTLELDPEERRVVIPQNLAEAFASHPLSKAGFEKLAYSHQKAYVDWILAAKKEETSQKRIDKALELLATGRKLR